MENEYTQQRAGLRMRAFDENAYILFEASTYRIGTTQTADVTATVRLRTDPDRPYGVEVFTCQITSPVEGEEARGRRVHEIKCTANWTIDSDSDEAMKDFTVSAFASSQGIGDLSQTATFKYSEMGR